MRSWYAVGSKPQREALAAAKLRADGVEVFYPTQRVRRHVRRGGALVPRWELRPYFTGWLFAKMSEAHFALVKENPAVSCIAGNSEAPVRIPEGVMGVLIAGASEAGVMGSRDEVARARFAAATRVSISEGPLAGVMASVLNDDGGDLVDLVVRMLGRGHHVAVPAATLELVGA